MKDADTTAVTAEVDLGVDVEGGIDGDAVAKGVNRNRSRVRREAPIIVRRARLESTHHPLLGQAKDYDGNQKM